MFLESAPPKGLPVGHPAGPFAAKLEEAAAVAERLRKKGVDIDVRLTMFGFSLTAASPYRNHRYGRLVTFEDVSLRPGNALAHQIESIAMDIELARQRA